MSGRNRVPNLRPKGRDVSAIGKTFKWSLIGLGSTIAGLAIWGFLIGPRLLDEDVETAEIPDLPPEWEGKEIAFISDLQVGMWWDNLGTIRDAIERIVRRRPAIVLIGGDLTETPAKNREQIRQAVEIVSPLPEAGLRTFAVLGNHDYAVVEKSDPKRADVARELAQRLTATHIHVLQNEAVPVRLPGGDGPLYIVGIGSNWANEDDVKAALEQVPPGAARFVVMHNPNSFADCPARECPTAVAGHNHGGQVRIPAAPQWSWLTFVRDDKVHADGWTRNYGAAGDHLYVNRGLGMSEVPIRINCTPELTYFRLTAGRASKPSSSATPENGVK